MATITPRLGLVKPGYTDSADIVVIDDNMDTIDGAVGVSIVNSVVDIPTPYNGQFAFENSTKQLKFFINGSWLLVAAGDLNSGNPNRIRLPSDALNGITDTTNAFQIGPDNAANLAMDANDIQSRANGVVATLRLNDLGGNVAIGLGATPVLINENGVSCVAMDPKEAFDGTNLIGISTSAPSWSTGSPNVQVDVTAPPSGRILALLAARTTITSNTGNVSVSFECTRLSNSQVILAPGGDTNTLVDSNNGANDSSNLTSSIPDVITGLVAGQTYRLQVQHQKNTGATAANIYFRKIIAIPQM